MSEHGAELTTEVRDAHDGSHDISEAARAAGWARLLDEDSGVPYFYHTTTHETAWDLPEYLQQGYVAQEAAAAAAAAGLADQAREAAARLRSAKDCCCRRASRA